MNGKRKSEIITANMRRRRELIITSSSQFNRASSTRNPNNKYGTANRIPI
jgi:hypothetical protein